ncbi:hypothetical protein [Mucilaginibacter sp.]|uniref:hypothetical protein n=1 Tax=Mucilaginibacter sp. TaxID=1882438 RepID=UPI0035BC1914
MSLPELYAQQERELKQYQEIRQQVWDRLQQEQQEFIAAFGSKEQLPEHIQQRIDKQIEDHNQEWAQDTGLRYQELQHNHIAQREAIVGKAISTPRPLSARKISPADKNAEQMNDNQKAMLDKLKNSRAGSKTASQEKKPLPPKKSDLPSQQELQKIIAQQKAIQEHKLNKKRGR